MLSMLSMTTIDMMLALLLISAGQPSLHIGSLVCQKSDGGVECDVEDEEEDENG